MLPAPVTACLFFKINHYACTELFIELSVFRVKYSNLMDAWRRTSGVVSSFISFLIHPLTNLWDNVVHTAGIPQLLQMNAGISYLFDYAIIEGCQAFNRII